MSKHSGTLDLPVPPDRAIDLCRRTLAALGWDLLEADAEHVRGREDVTLLRCRESPATVSFRLGPSEEGETLVHMETDVPGFGPIASRHLARRTDLVVRRLARTVRGEAG
jgi:hypothetical protein